MENNPCVKSGAGNPEYVGNFLNNPNPDCLRCDLPKTVYRFIDCYLTKDQFEEMKKSNKTVRTMLKEKRELLIISSRLS